MFFRNKKISFNLYTFFFLFMFSHCYSLEEDVVEAGNLFGLTDSIEIIRLAKFGSMLDKQIVEASKKKDAERVAKLVRLLEKRSGNGTLINFEGYIEYEKFENKVNALLNNLRNKEINAEDSKEFKKPNKSRKKKKNRKKIKEDYDILNNQLYQAVCKDNLNEVKQLINFGADVLYKNRIGRNLLMTAASHGAKNVFQYLFIQKFFDLNETTENGFTILHYAVGPQFGIFEENIKDREIILMSILGYIKDLNPLSSKDWTPLHVAVAHGNLWAVKILIEIALADITSKTIDNKTALDIAKEYEQKDIYEYLSSFINS